jgi:hypothetical protein
MKSKVDSNIFVLGNACIPGDKQNYQESLDWYAGIVAVVFG